MDRKQYWHDTFEKTAGRSTTSARSSFFSNTNVRALHNEVRRLLGRPVGKTIIDVGCGDGSLLRHLTQTNRVIGLDYSLNMLEHAAASGLEPLHADFDNIPICAESFDIVVSVEAVTLSEKPYDCIARLMNLLAPRGILILSVLNNCSILRQVVSPFFRLFVKQLPTALHPNRTCCVIRRHGGDVVKLSTTLIFPGKSIIRSMQLGAPSMYLGNNIIIKAIKK
jgi:2-polyprenyl-3-methyl-5-hydroxy-6-metoxy-1,4-benzoquinol methylase